MILSTSGARPFVWGAAALMMAALPLLPPRPDDPRDEPPEPPGRAWPMFGGSPGRNMVNTIERELPTDWSVVEGRHKHVKWVADLGSHTAGSPVVARGKVFVATNNARPRDPRVQGDKAVLMAANGTLYVTTRAKLFALGAP